MKVLLATLDTGSVREYLFSRETDTSDASAPVPEHRVLSRTAGDPALHLVLVGGGGIVLARKSGKLQLFGADLTEERTIGDGHGEIVGIAATGVGQRTVVGVAADGNGFIYNLNDDTAAPVHFKLSTAAVRGRSKGKPVGNIAGALTVFVRHPDPASCVFAYAGREVLPVIIELDLASGAVNTLWTAKNPKNTTLDLSEPNLVTAAAFVPAPELASNSETAKKYIFATATSHGKVRVYNSAHGGRPVDTAQVGKPALTAIVAPASDRLILADAQGAQSLWSVKPLRRLGNFKGITGATRAVHVRGRYVVSGGLDRYLRVFNAETRGAAGKVYVGEELSAALLLQDDEEKHALDEEAVWEDLDKIGRGKLKKARK